MVRFRGVTAGKEDLPANFHLPRHRHFHSYATLVLAGSFEEAGYAGRIRATEGDLLIHPVLDCHVNRMITPGVRLLRLRWPNSAFGGLYHVDGMDAVVRAAEKDMAEAALLVQELIRDRKCRLPSMNDWPDLLAGTIKKVGAVRISKWAEGCGLSREKVSRGFSAVYGIPPAGFRSEWRARAAWLKLGNDAQSLSMIAARSGFADQAHMTRWIGRVSGAPPSFWRVQGKASRNPNAVVGGTHSRFS